MANSPTVVEWNETLDAIRESRKTLLFIVSGPTGSGKTTICDRLLEAFPEKLVRIVTATTRPPRDGEQNGRDYHFFDPEEFQQKVESGDFYEHATVHGRSYGVLKEEVDSKLRSNRHALLNIDVQGAESFRKAAKDDPLLASRLVSLFLMLPALDEIQERLEERGGPITDLEDRLVSAGREMEQWQYYDYTIISGTREEDFLAAASIFRAECLRRR